MFIQVIQGMCTDEAMLRQQMDRWREELAPGAQGWLGGTYGMTDDGQFVAVVRFESREAAARNSLRPEQGEWWAAASRCFDGEVSFHDCDDAIMMLDGGSDDAGFVQVIQGRLEDPTRFREFMSQPMDMLHEARPEIIGGTIAIDADGWFTETMAFRSEAEARQGEQMEMPDEMAAQFNREMEQVREMRFLDLHHPWFASAGSGGM
jgi:hypothetical protein